MKNMNVKEMNGEFIDIWDNAIKKRLENKEISSEMDLQAIFHSELEERKLIGGESPLWRCYHDLVLFYKDHKEVDKKKKQKKFDITLMKYEIEKDPKKYYPAIVAEFKVWKTKNSDFKDDVEKLKTLFKDIKVGKYCIAKPYALHLMCIIIRYNNKREEWIQKAKEILKPGWEIFPGEPVSSPSEILVNEYCAPGAYRNYLEDQNFWKLSERVKHIFQIRISQITEM